MKELHGLVFAYMGPADDVPPFLAACREVADETNIVDIETVRYKISVKTAS